MPDDAEPALTEATDETPDALVTLNRLLYAGLLLVSIVATVDALTGSMLEVRARYWARRFWAQASAPWRERSDVRKAESWVVWEAMQVLEGSG